MSKYARDLDESLVAKVKNLSTQFGLKEQGINVEAIRLKKTKNTIGEVVKGNDLVKLFAGEDIVAVALYEDAFDLVDDQTQTIWIEGLLEQIVSEEDKEGNVKIKINKPELQLGVGVYHKYGKVAMDKAELALLTIDQIRDREREEKEAKKAKKQNKNKED